MTDHRLGHTNTFLYDELDRLTTVQRGSTVLHAYSYDPAGNMTSNSDVGGGTWTYNDANQLATVGNTTVSHDGQGNQTGTTSGDSYSYDQLNRPTSLTAGGITRAATYAGTNAVDRPSLGSVNYTTSLLGVTSQSSGASTVGYTRLPTGEVLSRRAGTDRHYYLPDMLGSTQALVRHTGVLTTRYTYTPYGQTTESNVGTGHVNQPYRYTGQHQDPTGLYKMGLRYYNPDQARWTQPDPALAPSSLPFGNTYLYAGSNPINAVDPTGAFSIYHPYIAFGVTVCGFVNSYCAVAGLFYAASAAGNELYYSICTDFGPINEPRCTPA